MPAVGSDASVDVPATSDGTAPGATARLTAAGLLRTLVLAVLFAVAVFLGRLTVMDGTSLSLVWPAAGVAALWFALQRRAGTRALDYVVLSGITFCINVLTGAPVLLSLCFVAANVAQVAVFDHLLRRWAGDLWGAGGGRPLTGMHQLVRVLGAALLGTGAGALIGPTAVGLLTGHWSWLTAAVWMTRNTVSVVLIMAVGLRVGYLLAARRLARADAGAGRPAGVVLSLQRVDRAKAAELVLLVVASLAAYLWVFLLLDGLPVAFPLVALTVWAALRFDTTLVVVHDLAMGVLAVVFTLLGSGPFAAVPDDATRGLVVQVYVGVIALVGLALALGRDERTLLLRRVEHDAAALVDQAGHMTTLAAASRQLYASEDVRNDLCEIVRRISGADLVYYLEPDNQDNLVTTASAGAGASPVRFRMTGEPSLTVAAFRGGSFAFVADVPGAPASSTRVQQGLRVASAAWQPVRSSTVDAVAVLALVWHRRRGSLPSHIAPVLETLGAEASAAVEREDMLRRLAQAAGRDPLTGLANRRSWDQTLELEIARARRTGLPLVVALVDLDHFKQYNDARGHLGGDALLKAFAASASGQLRELDTLARWGGEEFAIALPGCTADDALAVLGRVRAAVPDAQTGTVGLAEWADDESPTDIMARADRALYTGKGEGRDRTCVAPAPARYAPA